MMRTQLVAEGLTTQEAQQRAAEIDEALGTLTTAESPEERQSLHGLRELATLLRAGAGAGDDPG